MYTVWAEWEGGGLGRGIGVVEGSEGTWEREDCRNHPSGHGGKILLHAVIWINTEL